MKNKYLKELKELLDGYDMDDVEKSDIISDYAEMYENWIDLGMTEEQVEEKLGKPSKIIHQLTEGYKRSVSIPSKKHKLIALSPFIAVIIFFIGGFAFDRFDISWIAFLLIPVTAIIVEEGKNKHLLTALSPFIAVVAFFILGFFYDLWHPGWMVFLLVPVIAIISSRDEMNFLSLITALSPFAALVIFIYLGEQGYWIPGWLVFLAVPMIGILHESNLMKKLIFESLFVLGILLYLYVGYTYDEWNFALLGFAPIVIYGLLTGDIQVEYNHKIQYKILLLVSLAVYAVLGFVFGLWSFGWIVFFSIPVYAIWTEVNEEDRLVATAPFIATTIFMVLGTFFGIWEYAWMAFLLIPMIAIIRNA